MHIEELGPDTLNDGEVLAAKNVNVLGLENLIADLVDDTLGAQLAEKSRILSVIHVIGGLITDESGDLNQAIDTQGL